MSFRASVTEPAAGWSGGKRSLAVAAVLWVTLFSCRREGTTPAWEGSVREEATESLEVTAGVVAPSSQSIPLTSAAGNIPVKLGPGDPTEIRFMAYNVYNWLEMERTIDRKKVDAAPKPEAERTAVVAMIHRQRPDIVGLCEIGTKKDLLELQRRLKASGTDLPHYHFSGGSDPVRHLGLLSRFPITATHEPKDTSFRISGTTYRMNRGILDATIDVGSMEIRFLGVHLKSKREVDDSDQEALRLGEATLLRRHVDGILKAAPKSRLVVYGDFNDTRLSPTGRKVTGNYNSDTYLTALPVHDSRGETWTHHWRSQDVYSRIDFITVSGSMRASVDFEKSFIADDADWADASDHRPMVAIFRAFK